MKEPYVREGMELVEQPNHEDPVCDCDWFNQGVAG